MRTVTIYSYLLLMKPVSGNAKLRCANALGSKEKSQSESEGREVRTQAWTRRVESGTTTTCASVEGF